MKPTIIIDNAIPYTQGVLEDVADVVRLPATDITHQAVHAADALIIRTRTHCNATLLNGSRVRFVGSATIGFDHIDTAWCATHGITWCTAPGCNAEAVAQYVLTAISHYAVWQHLNISNLTIGIVGVGHVGTRVAELAKRMDMRILLNDAPRAVVENHSQFVAIDEVVRHADIITFHTPLTTQGDYPTLYLADMDFFDHLQRKPLIINAARGGVVDEIGLLQAYAAGRINAVVLDCWEHEPEINRTMLQTAWIATPHIAGYSVNGKANATEQCIRAVSRFFGLGIDNFRVTTLPNMPPCQAATPTELQQVFLNAYDIEGDSVRLKAHPETFEQQRTHYALRNDLQIV